MDVPVKARIIIDTFDSAGHIAGKKRTYDAVKSAVLDAGRFSTFEACESMRSAKLFMRLERDPEIEVFKMGYPWHGVRRRAPTAQPSDTEVPDAIP